MVAKSCRLCFKKVTRPIGIFSAEGIELNIVKILRLHFPDEVNEHDEHLPKFICLDCWIKSKYFHEFYNAVADAKNAHLTNLVKTDEPTFIEVNCNLHGYDSDIPSVKVEAIISDGDDDDNANCIDATDNNNEFEIEHETQPNHDFDGYGSEDDFNGMNTSVIDNNDQVNREETASKHDPITDVTIGANAAAELAKKIYKKTSKSTTDEFMNLIPNYFDMICELCNFKFKSLNNVFRHYRYKHDNVKIKVKCCPERIASSDLREHILHHLNPDLYKCNECGKKFTLGRQYRLHAQIHQLQLIKCDICKKRFSCKRGIIKHMTNIHGRNKGRFECDICKKRFNAKSTMKEHVKIEHQYIRHVCHVCAKEYRTLTGLQAHLRSHSDKGPQVKCKMCPRLFTNMYRLRLHQAKDHENATLLQCPHCPKKKTNQFQLKKHIAHSHNYKVHKCHLCEREFRSPAEVARHMRKHITGELFKCDYCPKQYPQQRDATKHMKTVHPIEWSTETNRRTVGN